jgi:membrane protein DedA with SNARE-associated domain
MLNHPNDAILVGLFFLVMIQEDSGVVSAALLGYHNVFPYWLTFTACFLGMWVSDVGIYFIVKFGGRRVLELRWGRRLLPVNKVDRATRWFDRYGGFTLVFSRFVLGTRTALLVVSGLLRYPAAKFFVVSAISGIGWLLLVFSLFALLGQSATAVFGVRWTIALFVLVSGSTAWLATRLRSRISRQADFAQVSNVSKLPGQNSTETEASLAEATSAKQVKTD